MIITLDTTRADRLRLYGFMDAVDASLDRLAREGVVFDQATSVAPLTLPAQAACSRACFRRRTVFATMPIGALAAEHTTLAEMLHARGFRTGAFVGSVVLEADRGLAQGFERYSGVGPTARH